MSRNLENSSGNQSATLMCMYAQDEGNRQNQEMDDVQQSLKKFQAILY